MKPFLSRTWSTISDVVTFGPARRRRTNTSSTNSSNDSFTNSDRYTLSLHSMPPPPSALFLPVNAVSEEVGGVTGSWSIYGNHTLSPSPEAFDGTEDDVIFCKNNVCYRIPRHAPSPNASFTCTSSSEHDPLSFKMRDIETTPTPSPPTLATSSRTTLTQDDEEEEEEEVEGYMYICTRGSDFGQTLILNWTPNDHMTNHAHNPDDSRDRNSAPSNRTTLENESESTTRGGGGATCSGSDRREVHHESLSLDLGRMETIRIFYHFESPSTGITSGEMVICSQERKLYIFSFKHTGLYDLIKKFRSWRYFTYVHSSEANQYTFTIVRPRLTLSELHVEEGLVGGVLTEDMWGQLKDPMGRILDKKLVLQVRVSL